MTGILELIRKLVGAGDSAGPFDTDILTYINSVLFTLTQLGVGPVAGFVANEDSEWIEFLPASMKLELVKTYVCLKVRLIFDPPASAAALSAMERQAAEHEWRIQVAVDPVLVIPSEGGVADE